jgi:hypothetical protein
MIARRGADDCERLQIGNRLARMGDEGERQQERKKPDRTLMVHAFFLSSMISVRKLP